MKFLKLLLAFAAFFFCNPLFAQKKTIPGYYITSQGDTIKGVFPSYAQWNKNPSLIEFKIDGSRNNVLLTPQSAHKVEIEGYDEYVSYTGNRLINPIQDAVLINGKYLAGFDDSSELITTFLRLVKRTTGGNLYVFNDAKRINFFYQLPGQAIREFRYKKTIIQNQINERADYRQQLNSLFSERIVEKNLMSTLERLPYQEEELSSFFEFLFPTENHERKKQNAGSSCIISAGAVLNMLRVQAGKGFNSVPVSYASSFSPLIGIGFLVPIGRNFGKYFFYPQVKIFRYKNTGEENQGTFINTVIYQADVAIIAQVSGGVNIVNQESRRVFITGGFGAFGQLDGKEIKQLSAASDPNNPVETKLRGLSYSIEVSAGAELNKRILLSAVYTIPTTIANFVFYSPKLAGIQLEIGYKL